MSARKTQARKKEESYAEYVSFRAVKWVGSLPSLIFHTVAFAGSFSLYFFGFDFNSILLVVTTIVSLEAIYLSIFVQMTLNRHSEELEEIQEDVDEIQEDVDEIQEDVEDIQEEIVDEDGNPAEQLVPGATGSGEAATLSRIERELARVAAEIAALRQSR